MYGVWRQRLVVRYGPGACWYDFDEFWQLGRRFNDWHAKRGMWLQRAASPDVAFYHRRKREVYREGDPCLRQAMLQMREPLYACGPSCGWFLLQDLLEGHLRIPVWWCFCSPGGWITIRVERLLPKLGENRALMGGMGQTAPEISARLCGWRRNRPAAARSGWKR